jgi:hypothetical protein
MQRVSRGHYLDCMLISNQIDVFFRNMWQPGLSIG